MANKKRTAKCRLSALQDIILIRHYKYMKKIFIFLALATFLGGFFRPHQFILTGICLTLLWINNKTK